MKKFKAFLSAACALLLCVSLAACGSKISSPMSAEETHKLCETYELKTRWIISIPSSDYHPLKTIASNSHYNYLLCLFVVTGYEQEPTNPSDENFYNISVRVMEVYSGDQAFTGKKVTFGRRLADDSSIASAVGQKYVGYFVDDNQPYNFWTFLVTDDNLLVSPFGCQVEEGECSSFRYNNISMECRGYTGKPLSVLLDNVKRLSS